MKNQKLIKEVSDCMEFWKTEIKNKYGNEINISTMYYTSNYAYKCSFRIGKKDALVHEYELLFESSTNTGNCVIRLFRYNDELIYIFDIPKTCISYNIDMILKRLCRVYDCDIYG